MLVLIFFIQKHLFNNSQPQCNLQEHTDVRFDLSYKVNKHVYDKVLCYNTVWKEVEKRIKNNLTLCNVLLNVY